MTTKGIVLRVLATFFSVWLYAWLNAILTPIGTVAAGGAAARQFDNSDVSYIGTFLELRFFAGFGVPFWLLLFLLAVIW